MNLYRLDQDENSGYDTYSDCVVCAENEDEARKISPQEWRSDISWWEVEKDRYGCWASKLENVNVEFLGTAKPSLPKGVVCSSFHAG